MKSSLILILCLTLFSCSKSSNEDAASASSSGASSAPKTQEPREQAIEKPTNLRFDEQESEQASGQPKTYSFFVGEQLDLAAPFVDGGAVEEFTISPALPLGLQLDSLTGQLSGTPEEVSLAPDNSAKSYLLTAKNSAGEVQREISISVRQPIPVTFNYNSPDIVFEQGSAINPLVVALSGGGPVESFQLSGDLPSGLVFNTETGEISGTPLEESERTKYSVTAINSGGSISTDVWITINSTVVAPRKLKFEGKEGFQLYVGKEMNKATPVFSGSPVDKFTLEPALPAGLSFDEKTGSISGAPEKELVGYTSPPGKTFTMTATNRAGVTKLVFGIAIAEKAPKNLSYEIQEAVYQVGKEITPNIPTVSGGPVAFFKVGFDDNPKGLPAGLLIDPVSGVISGTPTESIDKKKYSVKAVNSGGNSSTELWIKILPLNVIDDSVVFLEDYGTCKKDEGQYRIGTHLNMDICYQAGSTEIHCSGEGVHRLEIDEDVFCLKPIVNSLFEKYQFSASKLTQAHSCPPDMKYVGLQGGKPGCVDQWYFSISDRYPQVCKAFLQGTARLKTFEGDQKTYCSAIKEYKGNKYWHLLKVGEENVNCPDPKYYAHYGKYNGKSVCVKLDGAYAEKCNTELGIKTLNPRGKGFYRYCLHEDFKAKTRGINRIVAIRMKYQSLTYFDELTGACLDRDGYHRYITNNLYECGDVSGRRLDNVSLIDRKDFKGLNLKDATIRNSQIDFKELALAEVKFNEKTSLSEEQGDAFDKLFHGYVEGIWEQKGSVDAFKQANEELIEARTKAITEYGSANAERKLEIEQQMKSLQATRDRLYHLSTAHQFKLPRLYHGMARSYEYIKDGGVTSIVAASTKSHQLASDKDVFIVEKEEFERASLDEEGFAISFWVKSNGSQSKRRYFLAAESAREDTIAVYKSWKKAPVGLLLSTDRWGDIGLHVGSNSKRIDYSNGFNKTGSRTGLTNGQWHHLVVNVNYADKYVDLFFDGEKLRRINVKKGIAPLGNQFILGGRFLDKNYKDHRRLDGQYDELIMARGNFSEDKIQELYNSGVPLKAVSFADSTEFVNYWSFEDQNSDEPNSGSIYTNYVTNKKTKLKSYQEPGRSIANE